MKSSSSHQAGPRVQREDGILEAISTSSYFGRNAYWIQRASAGVLNGKDSDKIDTARGAYLATAAARARARTTSVPTLSNSRGRMAVELSSPRDWHGLIEGWHHPRRASASCSSPAAMSPAEAGDVGPQRGYLVVEAGPDVPHQHKIRR
ncbi:hypothetical protein GCM10020221_35150 [Streptomyces thioluteus]|uniref:Uncharacterized protein n=1 Tax=Streptomyces thioluteus TaxID=66431 RepID=A0ABP6JKI3_STRTU